MRSTLAALLVVTAVFLPAVPAQAGGGDFRFAAATLAAPGDLVRGVPSPAAASGAAATPRAARTCVAGEHADAAGDVPALDAVGYATRTCGGWEASTVTFSARTADDWRDEDLGEFAVMVSDGRPGTGCADLGDLDALVAAYYDADSGRLEAGGVQFATCDDQLGVFVEVARDGVDHIAVTVPGDALGKAPQVRFAVTLTALSDDDSDGPEDWMPDASQDLPLVDRFLGSAPSFAGTARQILDACPPGVVDSAGFADTAGNVHRAAIDCVAWWGVAKGVTATSYRPAAVVTRGQMASFLARVVDASEIGLPVEIRDRFADDAGSEHEGAVNRLATVGIVNGYADGRYGLDDPVSRAQMATFLMRTHAYVAGTGVEPGADQFGDDGDSVHHDAINQAAAAGIAAGVAAERYDPDALVRRDQMASFVARLLDLLAADGWARSPLF